MFKSNVFIIFINKANSWISTLMAEKKTAKKTAKKTSKAKTSKTKGASKTKTRSKKDQNEDYGDGIAIIDDDLSIDQEKINEERRAYLEEARSQEATD